MRRWVGERGWQKVERAAMEGEWTMRGLSLGRPLAAKMRRMADESRALPARPYTVSVGRPTTPPERRTEAGEERRAEREEGGVDTGHGQTVKLDMAEAEKQRRRGEVGS